MIQFTRNYSDRSNNYGFQFEFHCEFCSECGKPLAAAKVHCTRCGTELKPTARFCGECGTARGS